MNSSTSPTTSINLQRVADYARLSEDDAKDPDLRGENVRIQLDECEVFRATRPDWLHVDSFSDNDISASAYGSEERPDFEKLMALVRASDIDIILCVEVTRLFRKPLEAEVLIDLVWSKKTSFHTIVTTRGGYFDLRTSAGRKAVRDAVNAAAGESDNISDRVRVKKNALARKGKPNGGRRPYGFEKDQIAHRPAEITVLREQAARVIDGESTMSIIADLNQRGIPTAEGHMWTKATMVNMLRRKRYGEYGSTGKGIRVNNGAEYQAVWDAVFDTATFERLQQALKANAQLQAQRGNPRKYLLVGFLFCGECQSKLGGSMKRDRPHLRNLPRYKCKVYDAFGRRAGCARVSRLAEPVEDLVMDAVLSRLDSKEFASAYAETEEESMLLKAALDAHQAQQQRLDSLVDDYYGANPDRLSREQFMRAKTAAEVELARLERQVEKFSSKRALAGVPIGTTIREAWERNEDLGWRRQIIGLLVDQIFIHHGGGKPMYKGRWKFDPNQVEIIWKV